MPIQPMFLVETSSYDKAAIKFAQRNTPVFSVIRIPVLESEIKTRLLYDYGLLVSMVLIGILSTGHPVTIVLIGLLFGFTVLDNYYQDYSLEVYERYQRKRNKMITERRVVELPVEMLYAWKRAYERIGINVSTDEARMEFGRLCHDPHTRSRLIEQRRAFIAADCEPCRWRAIADMRNEMSAILQERIRDRQIDTRPGRLLL